MSTYWKERWDKTKQYSFDKILANNDAILRQVYINTSKNLVQKITAIYNKLLNKAAGNTVTRNMLYTLDGYKEMLKEVEEELKKLGIKIDKSTLNSLEDAYKESVEITGEELKKQGLETSFRDLDKRAELAAKEVWADDGQNWSERIWKNTGALQEKLLDRLTSAIATGEGPLVLEAELMKDFSVSYSSARRLVVTEMNHCYNAGSIDRMKDAGIEEWEWFTSEDERVCPECRSLHGKRFPLSNRNVPPQHPNCRCSTLAVIDKKLINKKPEKAS